jgi:hypothetical protein
MRILEVRPIFDLPPLPELLLVSELICRQAISIGDPGGGKASSGRILERFDKSAQPAIALTPAENTPQMTTVSCLPREQE